MFSHQFLRGSVVATLTSLLASVFTYIFSLLVARFFSLYIYGEYYTAMSYMTILAVPFAAVGFGVVKLLGSFPLVERSSALSQLAKSFWLKFIHYSWLLTLLAFFIGWFLLQISGLKIISIIMILSVTAASFFVTLYTAGMQSQKLFFAQGVMAAGATLIRVIALILVILLSSSLKGIYQSVLFSTVLLVIMYWLFNRRKIKKQKSTFRSNLNLRLFSKTLWLPLATGLGLSAVLGIDLMMAKHFFSASQVGLYAGLSLLSKTIFYFVAPIISVSFAFFTGKENLPKRNQFLLIAVFAILAIGSGATILYTFFPALILGILFGGKFIEIVPLMTLAGIYGTLYSIVTVITQHALSRNHLTSAIPLIMVTIQATGIWLFHDNFTQVMLVNLSTMCLILAYYFFYYIFFLKMEASPSQEQKSN
ncbi:MAG: hypothetical protein COY80_04290 [Candidatus Pacebacteria bacterium CG_4_10_14_0_8_um_filter_42_14]|nr:MAG: hypothetical protein COY80_04290 [Candidatus Pacebacteria bacterium CG_4_10_14_0_8_um_filter_42_14]